MTPALPVLESDDHGPVAPLKAPEVAPRVGHPSSGSGDGAASGASLLSAHDLANPGVIVYFASDAVRRRDLHGKRPLVGVRIDPALVRQVRCEECDGKGSVRYRLPGGGDVPAFCDDCNETGVEEITCLPCESYVSECIDALIAGRVRPGCAVSKGDA